jgi:entericidin A
MRQCFALLIASLMLTALAACNSELFMRQCFALLIASLMLTALAACNTVQGVGRDIESVGRAGKDAMH